MSDTNRYVVKGRRHTDNQQTVLIPRGIVPVRPDEPPLHIAKGTRRNLEPMQFAPAPRADSAAVEHQLGMKWVVEMRVENFFRNCAYAGGFETARRIGASFPQWEPEEEWERW